MNETIFAKYLALYLTHSICSTLVPHFFRVYLDISLIVAQTVRNLPAIQETWVKKIPWRREWQPTPVFLPGESYGQREDYNPWGRK